MAYFIGKMQMAFVALCAIIILGIAAHVSAASIGNTIWNDRNANGVQDAGEEGISGVKVKLYNGNDIQTDKTNSQGRYKFKNLDNGHYDVVVAQEYLPEGCYNTYDRDGNKDGKYEDKWVSDDDYYTHADFGYHCPEKTYVAIGQSSPVTGPSTAVAIMAIAVVSGGALFVYKRYGKKNTLKK